MRFPLVLVVLLLGGCATKERDFLRLDASHAGVTATVKGFDDRNLNSFIDLSENDRQRLLQVRVADAPGEFPAVLGKISARDGELLFTPRYPFQPGLKYRATFDPAILGMSRPQLITDFTIPAPSTPPVARVLAIYPSSNQLPENLLKFYIHFSAPMSRGEAYERISLLDENGKLVARPFLELTEELWNPEMTRFTLFFEPGRIKQGLVPREELGPSLTIGHSYTLLVDGAWRDGENRPLIESAKKTFRIVPPDHTQPDPARWEINSPRSGSKEQLSIHFDKPLDHAMLGRVLSVRDASGRELLGTISIDEQEQRWSFTPALPWQRGRYVVVVDSILEDVAGNSIDRPFEVDLNRSSSNDRPEHIEIRFEVTYRSDQKS